MKTLCIIALVLVMALCIGGIVFTWFTNIYTETPTENGEIVAVYLPGWVQNIVKTVATVLWTGALLYAATAIHKICVMDAAFRLEEAKQLDEFYNNLRRNEGDKGCMAMPYDEYEVSLDYE